MVAIPLAALAASVVTFRGLVPAWQASRLNPVEALRKLEVSLEVILGQVVVLSMSQRCFSQLRAKNHYLLISS